MRGTHANDQANILKMMGSGNRILSMLLWLSFTLPPVSTQAAWYSDEQAIMGTPVRAKIWLEDPVQAKKALTAVMDEMRRIDQAMSPYIASSMLSELNRNASKHPIKVDRELFQLLLRSQQFSEMTHGAFDITFASVGHLYDYRKKIKPGQKDIEQVIAAIDYRHITLDKERQTVAFATPRVRIDLGGIAKGHAVDRCIEILKNRGVTSALVSAGGDSRILGDKWGKPWMIGVRDPRDKKGVLALLPLADTAVSTSGDYERYFIQDGVRHHHILNPSTGHSVSSVRSVTIIGPDTTTTDALSTSVFVLGPVKGMELVQRLPEIEAVIVDKDGKLVYSSGLENQGPSQASQNRTSPPETLPTGSE